MRIWAFPSFYPIKQPGMEWSGIFAHRLYKGLVANGADLKVVLPVAGHPVFPISQLHKKWRAARALNYPYKRTYDGIEVFHPRISNPKPSRIFGKSYEDRFVDAVTSFFKKEKITLHPANDVFLSQWLPDARLAQKAAHKLGVKSAIMSIGDDVVVWPQHSKTNYSMFQEAVTEADYLLTCADYLGQETNKLLGKPFTYDVIHWGVDHSFFRPVDNSEKLALRSQYNLPENKIVILMIGTAIKRKGWLDIFDALKQLADNDNVLLVGVHAGKPEFDLDTEATARGIGNIFLNLGEVPPDQLNKIYNLADIFCLPSHWEGLANVVIEAMSSGLPVVTTSVCGHPEIISDKKNGILIPPKEPMAIYTALSNLIADRTLRETLGNNARIHITECWGNFAFNSKKLFDILSKRKL